MGQFLFPEKICIIDRKARKLKTETKTQRVLICAHKMIRFCLGLHRSLMRSICGKFSQFFYNSKLVFKTS